MCAGPTPPRSDPSWRYVYTPAAGIPGAAAAPPSARKSRRALSSDTGVLSPARSQNQIPAPIAASTTTASTTRSGFRIRDGNTVGM